MASVKVEISFEYELDDSEFALMKSMETLSTFKLELKEELEEEFEEHHNLNIKVYVNEL